MISKNGQGSDMKMNQNSTQGRMFLSAATAPAFLSALGPARFVGPGGDECGDDGLDWTAGKLYNPCPHED